ncbi:transcriptional regulator [Haloactinopolyspora alba]|uniref:Transcriptional regulator n=1 Tax=Haloactinopolyspora alba TaxID=648780 RepID=A0A2P8E416_9ACTN|nr:transcriptional regulator [Haloactinopolyspora alba]
MPYTLHPYTHDSSAPSFGLEAARALGVVPARVFKTLLAEIDDAFVVAVVPVSGSLDLKALARAASGKRAVMAATSRAERATGYVVGGISPFGQRKKLPTVVDESVFDHETVYVSAGRRGLDLEITPSNLVRTTEAKTATIARVS